MAQFTHPSILQRVSEAPRKLRASWGEGISLETRSGHTLAELRDRSVADRLALAGDAGPPMLDHLDTLTPPMHRDAISHYYSSITPFGRSWYFANDGDDFEEHSKLPTGIPDGLSER